MNVEYKIEILNESGEVTGTSWATSLPEGARFATAELVENPETGEKKFPWFDEDGENVTRTGRIVRDV